MGNFIRVKPVYIRIAATILLLLLLIGCSKKDSCHLVEITKTATPCSNWGIVDAGKVYPSENIPDSFKVNGLKVCSTYETYEDMRLCACCGGTYARITSMSKLP